MTSELDGFVERWNALAAAYQRTPPQIAAAYARRYTTSIRDSIAGVTRGSKLSGVGKFNKGARKGARVGVTSNVQGGEAGAVAIVQATGPLHLIERDTKGGYTIPRTQGSRRLRTAAGRLSRKRELTGRSFSGRKFLGNLGSFHAMGPVTRLHGTHGKHPFERGVTGAERQAFIDAVTEFEKSVLGIFKAGSR